ncbi:MAG: cytochrome C [Candidatus Marinimicrobia bacterium]|nr:cytochrome C [Candidatus Neomarinimicrobiota bacterium]MBT3496267.1 cytochrome C [Candidatus Neomarinimicrobiota bacterium]MBT3691604.1 cytochrome C [Candidatus Neomarinimicrobiota bacterium]MBT3732364.1 cytochrome C [Candidatus Neomarinimicrobiota bacterium]MBT4145227.1 cytochrome C [Candidatus Neomarinimicrobiota bacterium]
MLQTFKDIIDILSVPTISFTFLTVAFPFIFPPSDWFEKVHRKLGIWRLWTKPGFYGGMIAITGFFVIGYFDPNFHITLTKADNFPIVLMVYSMFITIWWSMYQAYENDARLEKGLKPMEYNDPDDKVLVWPDLVYIEFIALILFMVFLIVWSILVAAPLEEPANPASTPNPSKAPWYFLGLQEMLVYFDPWIAGIVFPMFIIIGMMAIPYMDVNKKGDGYYSFKERRIGMFIFMYGWLVLWLFLIVIGTFFRGPNWNFFGPFEFWDPHKVVPLNNVNLSEYVWVKLLGQGMPANILLRESIGFLALVGYMGFLPILLAKTWLKNYFQEIGPVRYTFLMMFGLSMLALPIKMYMRWLFNLKYIIAIPEWFFNI